MESDAFIEIAPAGYESLRAIRDRKVVRELINAIDALVHRPELQGKPLMHPFEGVRSVRAIRNRYRILYRVDADKKVVSVLFVGERRPGEERDVYAVAERLLRALRGEGPPSLDQPGSFQ